MKTEPILATSSFKIGEFITYAGQSFRIIDIKWEDYLDMYVYNIKDGNGISIVKRENELLDFKVGV